MLTTDHRGPRHAARGEPSPPESLEPWPWRERTALALSLAASRLLVGLLTAHLAVAVLPRGPYAAKAGSWGGAFLQWDSGWFLGIAHSGYPSPRDTSFFPGYPLLVRALWEATAHHLSLDACALALSWAAFGAGTLAVAAAGGLLSGRRQGLILTVLFVWSPASVFFLSAYPEGLLVALTALAVWCLLRDRLAAASVVAGAATALHPLGVAVAVAVAVELVRRRPWRRAVPLVAACGWGLAAWVSWQAVAYGHPLDFLDQQRTFNRRSTFPFANLVNVLEHPWAVRPPIGLTPENYRLVRLVNLGFEVVSLAVVVYFVVALFRGRRGGWPVFFSVYALVAALLPASSEQVFFGVANTEAMTRMTGSNLGVLAALARLVDRRPLLAPPLLGLWVALALVLQTLFVLGWYFT